MTGCDGGWPAVRGTAAGLVPLPAFAPAGVGVGAGVLPLPACAPPAVEADGGVVPFPSCAPAGVEAGAGVVPLPACAPPAVEAGAWVVPLRACPSRGADAIATPGLGSGGGVRWAPSRDGLPAPPGGCSLAAPLAGSRGLRRLAVIESSKIPAAPSAPRS